MVGKNFNDKSPDSVQIQSGPAGPVWQNWVSGPVRSSPNDSPKLLSQAETIITILLPIRKCRIISFKMNLMSKTFEFSINVLEKQLNFGMC